MILFCRPNRIALVLLSLTLSLTKSAQSQAQEPTGPSPSVGAEVSLTRAVTDQPWTGQAFTVNLDLKTPALSFSGVFFNLPELTGALALRVDTTTVKLSERRGGESWQVLRYPITVFPQQAGDLIIPSFEVRFQTQQGFGSTPEQHRLATPEISVRVRQPPGLAPGTVVVTTPRHTLDADWRVPEAPVETGDALILTIVRSAAGLSAMLLPPVPVFETEGLRAYRADPVIEDQTNRGQLTGRRTDRITWIIEQPGDYTLPALAFRSWDPVRERLQTQQVDGLAFTAEAAPGTAAGSEAQDTARLTPSKTVNWRAGLLVLGLLALAAWFIVRHRDELVAGLRAARVRILPPARALLRSLNPGAPS